MMKFLLFALAGTSCVGAIKTPAQVMEELTNGVIAQQMPALNAMILSQLTSYDPYVIPAVSNADLAFSYNNSPLQCQVAGTWKNGRINGATTLKINSVVVDSVTQNGLVLGGVVRGKITASISGSATIGAVASCKACVYTPYGEICTPEPTISSDLTATFSATVAGQMSFPVTADLLAAIKSQCVSTVTADTVSLSLGAVSYSVKTSNSALNLALSVFDTLIRAKLAPEIAKQVTQFQTTLASKAKDTANGLAGKIVCLPTAPPTPWAPTAPPSMPPTASQTDLEKFISAEITSRLPSMNSLVATSLATYDPFAVPSQSVTKSADLTICMATINAGVVNGAVTGAKNLHITGINMHDSTAVNGDVTSVLTVYAAGSLVGSAQISSSAVCGATTLSTTGTASFASDVKATMQFTIKAYAGAAIAGRCVNSITVGKFTVTPANLRLSLVTTNAAFNSLAPLVIDYLTPELLKNVDTVTSKLEPQLQASLSALSSIICKTTVPPTPIPPTPPPTIPPTNTEKTLEKYINDLVKAKITNINSLVNTMMGSYDPFTVPAQTIVKTFNIAAVGAVTVTAELKSGSVTGAKTLKVDGLSVSGTTVDLTTGSASTTVTIYASGPVAGTASVVGTAVNGATTVTSPATATFSSFVTATMAVTVTASIGQVITLQCVSSIVPGAFSVTPSALQLSLKTSVPAFDSFIPYVMDYLNPEILKQVSAVGANLGPSLKSALSALDSITCKPTPSPTAAAPTFPPSYPPTPVQSQTEILINKIVADQLPAMNSLISAKLVSFDPYQISAKKFTQTLTTPMCVASITADLTSASVTGAKGMQMTGLTISDAKVVGADVSAKVTVYVSGSLKGTAAVVGTAVCGDTTLTTPIGAAFSSDVEATMTLTVTANFAESLAGKCVSNIVVGTFGITPDNIQLSLKTTNAAFNEFAPTVVNFVKPFLLQNIGDLTKKLEPEVKNALSVLDGVKCKAPAPTPAALAPTMVPTVSQTDTEKLINKLVADRLGDINTLIGTKLKSYDPLAVPAKTVSKTFSTPLGDATVTATIKSGSVSGIKNMKIAGITVGGGTAVVDGNIKASVTVYVAGSLSGTAVVDGSAVLGATNLATGAAADFSADVEASLVITVTANFAQSLSGKCVGDIQVGSFKVRPSNLKLSLATSNAAFNGYSPFLIDYITPELLKNVDDLVKSVGPSITAALDDLNSIKCPATQAPTPIVPPTPVPVAAQTDLERIINTLVNDHVGAVNTMVSTKLAAFDPVAVPIKSVSKTFSTPLGNATVTANIKSGSVTGAKGIKITQVTVSDSVASGADIEAKVTVYVAGSLAGSAIVDSTAVVGSTVNLAGTITAAFATDVAASLTIKVTANFAQSLQGKCIGSYAMKGFSVNPSNFNGSVTTGNAAFDDFTPFIIEYITPEIYAQIATITKTLGTDLESALSVLDTIKCTGTVPPTNYVPTAPPTMSPTIVQTTIEQIISKVINARNADMTAMAVASLNDYDPYPLPAMDITKSFVTPICSLAVTGNLTSGSVTGAKGLKIARVTVTDSKVVGGDISMTVHLYASANVAGTASIDASATCAPTPTISTKASVSFSSSVSGFVSLTVVSNVGATLEGRCVKSIQVNSFTAYPSGLKLDLTTDIDAFKAYTPYIVDFVTPDVKAAITTLTGTLEDKVKAAVADLDSIICKPKAPTSKPTRQITTASPTQVVQPLEIMINEQLVTLKPTLNKEIAAALKSYDPFTIPIPPAFTKTMAIEGCDGGLVASATVLNGAATGASSMIIDKASMSISPEADFSNLFGNFSLTISGPIVGTINLAATGTCGDLALNSSMSAKFGATISATLLIHLKANVNEALQNKCVEKFAPFDLTVSWGDFDLELKSDIELFDAVSPLLIDYVRPMIEKEMAGVQDKLKAVLFSNADMAKSLICPSKAPSASPTAPPSAIAVAGASQVSVSAAAVAVGVVFAIMQF